MLPVKPYTIAVPANGSLQMQVTGRYLRVNACTNPISVSIDGVGTLGSIGAGQGFKLPADVPPFARLLFTDASGSTNNVTFIVADSDFVDNTVLGSVSVIDGGMARTLAGNAFMGAAAPAAGAGQLPAFQLWNNSPANNQKNLILKAFNCSNGATAQSINAGRHTVALASAPATVAISKLLGGAAATVGQTRQDTPAAAPITSTLLAFYLAANANFNFQFQEPLVIPPGQGFVVVGFAPASSIQGGFEWYEQSQ